MCGIAGFIGQYQSATDCLSQMASAIAHRGPDDQGVWFDEGVGVGLAHARLSILDLSPAGHQPMQSVSERYVMVFNGEIYNHNRLRTELESITVRNWRGHSDTETLLAAIEQWGLEATLKKTKGMFAIALWDKQTQTLSLGRDRMGEKPLYYGWASGQFVFASELKAIKTLPDFNNAISRDALALYLRYSAIPAPYSIYENLFKLEPGSLVTIRPGGGKIEKKSYWSTVDVINHGLQHPFKGSASGAVNQLEIVLKEAVALQMEADVPLGAFLSGGVDSSTVVALMQAQSAKKVKTFSIGFDNKAYNEAEHARTVAQHLCTEHFDMYVSGQDALDVIPKLPDIYDEPFADSSQIPTYLVSQIAKQKVTVSLSGDAGDELFGGYSRYTLASNTWNKLNKIPAPIRAALGAGINTLPAGFWKGLLSPVDFVKSKPDKPYSMGDKILKASALLACQTRREFYEKGFMSHNLNPQDWVLGAKSLAPIFDALDFSQTTFLEEMMALDMLHYLPTDILTKVDRAAMAVSLETRVPLLDSNVIEFAASLPLEYKIHNGVGKWVLREVLYKYVPKELIERPKMGFGVPLAEWLRGPLRDWAESLLDAKRLEEEGFFNVSLVRQKWQEHISGQRNWQAQLWDVLMFQAWLEKNK
ncbi:MAG: asparagine synthase (glutamine-hydrolyzing) [Shewanella sp. CG18_big_fil_WC_8_21_14_2_50_42_11]|uniref:asparagine synthase (glutamine-hydrolyzing) n=1 Tax=Shewanella TaxID=22 RepID=UPI000C6927BA|nr:MULTISPECIES: asparagine synthase (glutamine-hydrolyzing) [Shewanella]NCP72648.1 asparagine synthase (glutamine-hydrolyzing) [Shewanella vesiculosa]PIQ02089.1 MAG: asparagine synthase (glutamine-hydrolyzing) [Shewanella sp. CG18_big_fil_WC_8_21_14_2_50_42_11]